MVELVFDKSWDDEGASYGKINGDPNAYTTGVVANHNVVLAHMPGMGGNKAAAVATGLKLSYPAVEIAIVVGVCGAVPIHPRTKSEIILGDCIISTEAVQYDFGRQYPRGFAKKKTIEDGLAHASMDVRALASKLITERNRKRIASRLVHHLNVLQQTTVDAIYPGVSHDLLFQSEYEHRHRRGEPFCNECLGDLGTCFKSCDALGCDTNQLIARQRLENPNPLPIVHFGRVGSGNTVMRSGKDRDRIAKDGKLVAFEMEGSGVCDILPAIIIKSACDYSDSHKSKEWQPYAAATAACGLKAFLEKWEVQGAPINIVSHSKSTYVVPLLQNLYFTGRENYLEELEKRVFLERRSHELAIFGLGGVGKTQLVLAFCQIIKVRYPDYSIFWVSAISRARIRQDFARIAQACSLPAADDDPISQVQEHLNSERAGKWILVVDNADDKTILFGEDCVADKLPRSESGTTLFTTRYKGLAVDLAGSANILNLVQMEPHEAETFFKMGLGRYYPMQDGGTMMELFEELTYLPLAIAQASSYIVKTSITIRGYLALLKSTSDKLTSLLSREFRDKTRDKESVNAVAKTWLISFKHLKEEDPNAADILFFSSLLENKAIPLSILPRLKAQGDLQHALGVLTGYSFLSEHEKGGVYDMHRLVHRSTMIWMQIEDIYDEWLAKAVGHLAAIFPDYDWKKRDLWREYTVHAIRLLELSEDWPSEDRARLCLKVGKSFVGEARYDEAVMWCSKSVSWTKKHLRDDNSFRLDSVKYLAKAYAWDDQHKKAIDLYEWLIPRQKKKLGDDHLECLRLQDMLASAYSYVGRTQEAIELAERIARIRNTMLTEDHPVHLNFERNRAFLYRKSKQYGKAIDILEKLMAHAKKLAPDHPVRSSSQYQLAASYTDNGQLERAIDILNKSTKYGQWTPAVHPSRVRSQYELARAYIEDAQFDRAIEILENVVDINEKKLKWREGYSAQLKSQHALARAYHGGGQHDKAISLMQHVVKLRTKMLPADHEDRLQSESLLTQWLESRTD